MLRSNYSYVSFCMYALCEIAVYEAFGCWFRWAIAALDGYQKFDEVRVNV